MFGLQQPPPFHISLYASLVTVTLIVGSSLGLAKAQSPKNALPGESQRSASAQSQSLHRSASVRSPTVSAGSLRSKAEIRHRILWRESLRTVRAPKKGCFKAHYPDAVWQEIACAAPSRFKYSPGRRSISHLVGSGGVGDFSARTSGLIASAEGSFDSVSSGITEAGPNGGQGPQVNNAYSLQLNTNFFSNASACAGAAPGAPCVAWEQFVFSNDGLAGGAFIQYWLVNYNNQNCPAKWQRSLSSTGSDCVLNNQSGVTPIPPVAISDLAEVKVVGAVSPSSDQMIVFVDDFGYLVTGDNAVNAAQGWQEAEFNVFGNGNDGRAQFGPNTTLQVKTVLNGGSITAPACDKASFTGETNNLDLSGAPAMVTSSASPAISFTETNAAAAPAGCTATPGSGGSQMLISGEDHVDFGKDQTGLNHYSMNGAMCVVHSPGCSSNAFLGIFGVGHDGKDHFFPEDAALPAGVTVDGVLYTVFWPAGMDHTDRGGLNSKGSYGADADKELQKAPPLYSVHWQNACQASTGANWSALNLTYQVSFLITVPQGMDVPGAQPLSAPVGNICRVADRPTSNGNGTSSPTVSTYVAHLHSSAPSNGGALAWGFIFPPFGTVATSTPVSTWTVQSIANLNNFDVFLVGNGSTSDQCFQTGHGQRIKSKSILTDIASLYGSNHPPLALVACTAGSSVPTEVNLSITYQH